MASLMMMMRRTPTTEGELTFLLCKCCCVLGPSNVALISHSERVVKCGSLCGLALSVSVHEANLSEDG